MSTLTEKLEGKEKWLFGLWMNSPQARELESEAKAEEKKARAVHLKEIKRLLALPPCTQDRDWQIEQHRKALRNNCLPAVMEFRDRLLAEQNRVRAHGYQSTVGYGYSRGERVPYATGNSKAVGARVRALAEAMQRILELCYVDEDELPAEMQRIWDSLPETDSVWDDPETAALIARYAAEREAEAVKERSAAEAEVRQKVLAAKK